MVCLLIIILINTNELLINVESVHTENILAVCRKSTDRKYSNSTLLILIFFLETPALNQLAIDVFFYFLRKIEGERKKQRKRAI